MAKVNTARAYLDGFGTVRSVLDLDQLTAIETLDAFMPERERDPLLTP